MADRGGVDILAGERSSRRRRGWWPGNWFGGRLGVGVLLAFLGVGGYWMATESAFEYRVRGLGEGGPASGAHPEAGRSLRGQEVGLALRYGEPLHLGPGSLPVVKMGGGVVRELTPVEAEYDSAFLYEDAGYNGVVWGPGPRGWGMWWRGTGDIDVLQPSKRFSRLRWRDKQEDELEFGVAVASFGVALLAYVDMDHWERGIGEALVRIMGDFKDRHRAVEARYWGGVPGEWVCDEKLEVALTQGVSQGCPGGEYEALLIDAWVQVGEVVDTLEGVGRLLDVMDGMKSRDLYDSEVMSNLGFYFLDVRTAWIEMERSLSILREGTAWYGLPVEVMAFDPNW